VTLDLAIRAWAMADDTVTPGARTAPGGGTVGTIEAKIPQHGAWLHWSITMGSIALPVVVLLVVSFIPHDSLRWHSVSIAIQRGDFLIPVLIMCLDAIRRWWFDVQCGRVRFVVRLVATVLCTMAAIICLIATTASVHDRLTAPSGRAITSITLWCMGVAVLFGTLAVGSPAKRRGGH
jgi:hypothetical protein